MPPGIEQSLRRGIVSTVAGKRQIGGETVRLRGAVEEPDRTALRKGLRPPLEFLVPPQEFDGPAARCPAFRLTPGAGVVIAEPSEVTVRSGFQNEDVDMVGSNAVAVFVDQRAQGSSTDAAKFVQIARVRKPERQIHVRALVPEFDPGAAVRREAGHLALSS